MPVPNMIAALPGMDRMTTRMMRNKIDDNDVATVEELIETSLARAASNCRRVR